MVKLGVHALAAGLLAITLPVAGANPSPDWGLPLHGEQAEDFLRTAAVLSVRPLKSKAVTRPMKVELSDGTRFFSAVFKTIDEYEPVMRFDNGEVELQFTDSFEYEIAAYELDTMLGLGIVPPAIRRRINRHVGSLSLWVEGAMTEWERFEVKKEHPPDLMTWNEQMYTIRLFLQLIADSDYTNINNLLVTPDWKIYRSTRPCIPQPPATTPRGLAREILPSRARLAADPRTAGTRRKARSVADQEADRGPVGAPRPHPRTRRPPGRRAGRGGSAVRLSRQSRWAMSYGL